MGKQFINVNVDADFSGSLTIVSGSVPVQGANVNNSEGFVVKNSPKSGTNIVFMIGHGGLSKDGFPLTAGTEYHTTVSNLSLLDFGTTAGSGIVNWVKR
jgi:hypothetical protein